MGRLRTANRRRVALNQRRLLARRQSDLAWLREASIPCAAHRTGLASKEESGNAVQLLGRAPIPRGGELRLLQSGKSFSIQFGTDELMGSFDHASEEALATLTHERTVYGHGPVLIGGLGMGFTLRAALLAWQSPASVVVAELVPGVLEWAQGPLSEIYAGSLDDPRVSIAMRDVHDVIAGADGAFEAILLDVDNGPEGFMRPENDRIYSDSGIRSAYRALAPSGVLAIWSAYKDENFARTLRRAGFDVDIRTVAGDLQRHYIIWFATKAPVD